MSIKSFNESFRRQYQKDTVKKKDSSLYNRIVESVERASKNRGSGQNLSKYEQLIQEAIESSTGKNWYDVADVNMQQILFEEYDIKNAAKRLLHITESEDSYAGEYQYKGHTIKFNNMGTAQVIDNKTGKLVRSGVSDAEAEEWIDSVTNESLKEDTEKTSKGKWVNRGDSGETHGTFKTKKEADAQRKAMFARGYNEDWTSAYKNFEKIVDKYLPDEDKIQSEVEKLYNQHKGEPDWDKAWEKWNITDKVDTVDEALKTNSKKAMDNLKQYIMDNCTPEDYGVSVPSDFSGVATLILDTFRKEKYSSKEDYRYYHNNERAAFEDWMQGLPSIFNPGYYYQGSAVEDLGNILEETDEEKEKYSEEQAKNLLTQLIYRELKKAERKTESKRTKRCGKSLTEMKVTEDIDLRDFEFWSGARDNVKYLTDNELDTIQSILEDSYPDGMSKTDINDFFWFEDDTIAEWLGYDNFEQIINRDDDKGVGESFNGKHRVLRESSGMRKYSQKELRDLVRDGYAEDITQDDEETIQDIWRRCDKIGYSRGVYGLNGGLLEDPKTGNKYVVIGRSTNLFRLF